MTMNQAVGNDAASLERAGVLLKSVADPHRLQIVQHLLLGEHRVADLVSHLGLAQSTVSTHVARLREAGLVVGHTHGRATYYTLSHPKATRSLLAAAEHVLACTGEPVHLCRLDPEAGADG